jgi:hypothetical protein
VVIGAGWPVWVFEGTGMAAGDAIPNLVGHEWHGAPPEDLDGLELVSTTRVTLAERVSRAASAPLARRIGRRVDQEPTVSAGWI